MMKRISTLSVLGLAGVLGFPLEASATDATCSKQDSGAVQCVLPTDQDSYDLSNLVGAANGLNSKVNANTPMALTAFGGGGGNGLSNWGPGGDGGAGGKAETVTTAAKWQRTYGSSSMWYYVG